jgi:TonB family protein
MAAKTKPFDKFGPFILFKKLEEHRLGELWRAGRIDGNVIRNIALHRLTGGSVESLRQAAIHAAPAASHIAGTSIAKNQKIDVIDGVPVMEHEYDGGRSLRHIVAKAKNGTMPHPLAADQALAIVDKVAAAIEVVHNFRREGARTVHGAVIPHFIWITDDGEIRVAGQQLGKGLLASLSAPGVASEIGGYLAPEVRGFGEPSATGDIYSLGGILYLTLTGNEPPDPANAATFAQTLSSANLMDEEQMPQEIRALLQRSLSPDINGRYRSIAEFRKDLNALVHGGAYTASTFNLAFFLSTLLKKEFESEAVDREKESKVTPAMYADVAAPASTRRSAASSLSSPKSRSRAPLMVAAAALLAVAAVGAFLVFNRERAEAKPASQLAVQDSLPARRLQPRVLIPPPIVTAASTETAPPVDAETEAEERKKRIEEEVQRRLQSEMMKLQEQYERDLQRARGDSPQRQAERGEPMLRRDPELVASLSTRDEQPVTRRTEPPVVSPQPPATTTAPPIATTVPQSQPNLTPPTQQQPAVTETVATGVQTQEGDLIGYDQVDQPPKPRSEIRPTYPPIALRQRFEATVFLSALISETGQVLEVRVLRGDGRRVGFDEAAERAVRKVSFYPAIKDGKRVRTWLPIPIRFKP